MTQARAAAPSALDHVPREALRRSVAILVDDLVTWLASGLQPTGIQRVVSELLDTASARPDIRAWPAVSLSAGPAGQRPRLAGANPDDLRWETLQVGASLQLRSLRRARRAIVRLPVPRLVRSRARAIYARLALTLGGIRLMNEGEPETPDLLLIPGGFWSGDSPDRIQRLARLGVPIRLIIYDLFPIRSPEWYGSQLCRDFEEALDQLVPICDRIVTLSEEVASQVADRYPASTGRIRIAVPTLGAHAPRSGFGREDTRSPVAGPFLLALGTVEPRKNHRVILDAWRLAIDDPRVANASLVIAGRRGWKASDIEAEIARDAKRLGIVRFFHATDAEVDALYRDCVATVHASWAEGFGLPARESIVRGIPTLMSSTIPRDGLPDGTYQLFDPMDPAELAVEMIDAVVAGHVRIPIAVGEGTGWESVLSALVDE